MGHASRTALRNYLDRDGLARYFPIDAMQGSDALTAYLVQIAHDSGREWPEARARAHARGARSVRDRPHHARQRAAHRRPDDPQARGDRGAVAPRASAKPAMLDPIAIEPELWPTSALIDWIGILKRVNGVPKRAERLNEALGLLRARLNFQGTIMTFSTERNDALWWLMVSGDVNANRALLAVLDETGLARGRRAPRARHAVAPEARALEHHGRQRVGRGRAWRASREAFEKVAGERQQRPIALGGKSLPVKVGRERADARLRVARRRARR